MEQELSKDEVKKLTMEEIVRQQVREKLEAEKQSNRWWILVNSSFGLWLMSSIILTMVAFCYNGISNYLDSEKQLELTIENLQSEIGYRLDIKLVIEKFKNTEQNENFGLKINQVLVWCLPPTQTYTLNPLPKLLQNLEGEETNGLKINQNKVQPFAPSLEREINGSVKPNENIEYQQSLLAGRFIFPIYRDRSVFSLIWELRHIETDKDQLSLIAYAMNSFTAMRLASLSGNGGGSAREYLENIRALTKSWEKVTE